MDFIHPFSINKYSIIYNTKGEKIVQLRTNDFKFNGKKLSDFGFTVVNTSSASNTRKIGLSRSLNTVEGIRGNKVVNSITANSLSFPIVISKMDSKGMPQSITDTDLEKLTTWLFSPVNYEELVALDEVASIVYYGMFTDGEQTYLNNTNEGYITLTFELDGNHAYEPPFKQKYTVQSSMTFTITLNDNVSAYYYPDIEFSVTSSSFSIENTTLEETMSFSNLDSTCKKGIVYGEGIMTMISTTDNTVNMREKSNRVFLRLKHGDNIIKITGNGTFTFNMQPKISLR